VKKKHGPSFQDKRDWMLFTKQMGSVKAKSADLLEQNTNLNKIRKLDLHGFSLNEANKEVKKFIIESFNKGYKKLLIITGKGTRSKSHNNPYLSEKLSILQNSVPEYINSDDMLVEKITKISKASLEDGGAGAIYVFLKKS